MLIGRENEIVTLHGLMSSDESQFVAVYGRRRVGKTFLIREAYKSHFVFQHTGTYGATRRQPSSMNFLGWTRLNPTSSVHSTIFGTPGLLQEKTSSLSSAEAPHHGSLTMWS